MSDVTFQDYKRDPKRMALVTLLEAQYGIPLPDFLKKYLLDSANKSELRVQSAKNWIINLESIAEDIISGVARAEQYPLFWIYLCGVAIEYYEHQMEDREITEQKEFMKPVLEALDSIRNRLNEDDLTFIIFMRHSHVHIHLDTLWLRPVIKNGKLIGIKSPANPDAREIAARIFEEHDDNQGSIARDYAVMIIEDIRRLRMAVVDAEKE